MNTVFIDPHDIEMNLGMETANGGGENSINERIIDDSFIFFQIPKKERNMDDYANT